MLKQINPMKIKHKQSSTGGEDEGLKRRTNFKRSPVLSKMVRESKVY